MRFLSLIKASDRGAEVAAQLVADWNADKVQVRVVTPIRQDKVHRYTEEPISMGDLSSARGLSKAVSGGTIGVFIKKFTNKRVALTQKRTRRH